MDSNVEQRFVSRTDWFLGNSKYSYQLSRRFHEYGLLLSSLQLSPCLLRIFYAVMCTPGVRMSLETLRRRLQNIRLRVGDTEPVDSIQPPLFLVDLELSIPRIGVQPSLEETQTAVNRVAQFVLGSIEHVTQWEHLARQQLHLQKVG